MNSFFKNMQSTAFDNFDPGISYFDPSVMKAGANNATGDQAGSSTVAASPGQKMQVNLTLTNAAAVVLTFELFNYLNSYTRILNSTYATGNYQYIPLLTIEGLTEFAAATKRIVGFSDSGDLHIRGSAAVPDPTATIGCGEIGYSAFFEASNTTPFVVSFIRYTCETSQQIDKQITWFKKTFSGGELTNKISPRAYFKPTQFQSFIIDITVNFSIGYDSGLRTQLIAGEVVTLSLFINMWTEQAF